MKAPAIRALVLVAVTGLAAMVAALPLGCGDEAAGAAADAGMDAEAAPLTDGGGGDADASGVITMSARIDDGPVGVGLGTASWSATLRKLVVGPYGEST